jgi:hypothetical protein
MAYYLRFESGDHVTIPTLASTPTKAKIEIDFLSTGGGNVQGFGKAGGQRFYAGINGNKNFIIGVGGSVYQSGGAQLNTRYVLALEYDFVADTYAGTVDGNVVFSGSNASLTTLVDAALSIGRVHTSGNILNGDVYSAKIWLDDALVHNYDPSASNGTGSILPDTAGSNDGTLVNFPNDDSQWVFYDDGQGGIVTADAAYTIAAPAFTANASATLPQPAADGAFSIASPLFSASATPTLPQPIADAAFTINAPTFAATASATIPGFNASVSFAIPAPTFSADATVTLPSPTADVSYTIAAPTFSVDADATLPQPSSDVAFTVNSPSFAVTATATEPGFNASVNFTVNAPTFAVDATATLPQPSADVGFTVSAPTFSVVAIVGGIAIIVDNETNINVPALANNINAPVLSNNMRI